MSRMSYALKSFPVFIFHPQRWLRKSMVSPRYINQCSCHTIESPSEGVVQYSLRLWQEQPTAYRLGKWKMSERREPRNAAGTRRKSSLAPFHSGQRANSGQLVGNGFQK